MKLIFKIVGVLLLLFILLVVYGVYQSVSESAKVQSVTKASFEYFENNISFENFCNLPLVTDLDKSGFDVECADSNTDLLLTISTNENLYQCRNAVGRNTDGSSTNGLACLRTDNIGSATQDETGATGNNKKFNPDLTIATLVSNPDLCAHSSFIALKQGVPQLERAVMPGAYTAGLGNVLAGENAPENVGKSREEILAESALRNSLAVKSDGSVCKCSIGRERNGDRKVVSSEHGVINKDGVINWQGSRIPESSDINSNRTVGILPISLVAENGSYHVQVFQLNDDNECSGGNTRWQPTDYATEDDVCGCKI